MRNGDVPKVYKKTKLGIIPSDWEETYLKNNFDRLERRNIENNKNSINR